MNTFASLKQLTVVYSFADYTAVRSALSENGVAFKLKSDIIMKSELSLSRFGKRLEDEEQQITCYTFFVEEKHLQTAGDMVKRALAG